MAGNNLITAFFIRPDNSGLCYALRPYTGDKGHELCVLIDVERVVFERMELFMGILTVCSVSGITKGSTGLSVLAIPYFFRSSCSSFAFCSSKPGPSAAGVSFFGSSFFAAGGLADFRGFSLPK